MIEIDRMVNDYLETAFWCNDEEESLSGKTIYDLSEDTTRKVISDCADFLEMTSHIIGKYEAKPIGHDLFLTRNGHGAGFWDGDYSPDGDELTKYAESMGNVDLYAGDDGKVYLR